MQKSNRKTGIPPQMPRKTTAINPDPGPGRVLMPEILPAEPAVKPFPESETREQNLPGLPSLPLAQITRLIVRVWFVLLDQIDQQKAIRKAKIEGEQARQLDEMPRHWSGKPTRKKRPTRGRKTAIVVISGNNNKVNISQ